MQLSDRAAKKAKAFIDTTSKFKHRHAALLALAEVATEAELSSFYKEHIEYVVAFMTESTDLMLDRIAGNEGELQKSLGRERHELLKTPLVFLMTIKCISGLLLDSPKLQEAVLEIIRLLLHPENHPDIRQEGLQMLMAWIKLSKARMPPTLRAIYSTMIDIRVFGVGGQQADAPPLYSAFPYCTRWKGVVLRTQLQQRGQAVRLFHDLLHWMTFHADPDRGSVTLGWILLRDDYLDRLYHFEQEAQQDAPVHLRTPEEVQAVMVQALARWIVRTPLLYSSAWQAIPQAGVDPLPDPDEEIVEPMATFLWEDLLLGGDEEVEWCHRIIRAALLLPLRWYRPTIRQAISIMRTWTFVSRERRADFLQHHMPARHLTLESISGSRPGTPAPSPDQDGGSFVCKYVSRYLDMLYAVYSAHGLASSPSEAPQETARQETSRQETIQQETTRQETARQEAPNQGELVECFKDVQFFVRAVSMQTFFQLTEDAWFCLVNHQLAVTSAFLSQPSKTLIITASASGAESFAQMLVETLIGVYVRAHIVGAERWVELRQALGANLLRWPHAVHEWSSTLDALTKLLPHSFAADEEDLEERQRVSDSFSAWDDLPWARANGLFLWHNVLCLFHPNRCTCPTTWHSIIVALSSAQEALLTIRASQPYDAAVLPPVYGLVPLLLDASEHGLSVGEQFTLGTSLALDTLCTVMLRRHDMPFPDVYYARFYRILIDALKLDYISAEDVRSSACFPPYQLASVTTVICASSYLPILALPGWQVCIPAFRSTIGCLIEHWEQGVAAELHGMLVPIVKFALNTRDAALLTAIGTAACIAESVVARDTLVRACALLLASPVSSPASSQDRQEDGGLVAVLLRQIELMTSECDVLLDCMSFLAHIRDFDGSTLVRHLIGRIGDCSSPRLVEVLLGWAPRLSNDLLCLLVDALIAAGNATNHAISHLLHTHLAFPAFSHCSTGTDSVEAILSSPEGSLEYSDLDARTIFVALDGCAILSIHESAPEGQLQIILRNACGRFAWRTSSIFGKVDASDADLSMAKLQVAEKGVADEDVQQALSRPPRTIPRNDGKVALEQVDMLDELLQYIGEEHPELAAASLANPTFALNPELQYEFVQREAEPFVPEACPSARSVSLFTRARQLLLHLGLTNVQELCILDKTPQMFRDLRGLDTLPSRECFKAGMLYIAPGQEDEPAILGNNSPSEEYMLALRAMCWRLDLTRGAASGNPYTGGLEASSTADAHAWYYADPGYELVIHSAPHLAPSDAADPRHIRRKRHIGNDHVQVIWTDAERDYVRGTIRGDFSTVQIVIHPESDGFSIRTLIDERVAAFGPLMDGIVIGDLRALSPALRSTILSATRCAGQLVTSTLTASSMDLRQRDIATIVQRHAASSSGGAANAVDWWPSVVAAMVDPRTRPAEAIKESAPL